MRLTGQGDTEQIKQYKERLHIALSAAKICIFEVDLPRQLYTFFENAEIIFGVSGEKILRSRSAFWSRKSTVGRSADIFPIRTMKRSSPRPLPVC